MLGLTCSWEMNQSPAVATTSHLDGGADNRPTLSNKSSKNNLELDESESVSTHQRTSSKLVGNPLLYTITCFASLGVFLVSLSSVLHMDFAKFCLVRLCKLF